MKKRTTFIAAILSLFSLGQPLLIKTGFALSNIGLTFFIIEKVNADQVNDLYIGYGHNQEFFDINILQKWMKFIGLLEQVWEISLTKIIKKL